MRTFIALDLPEYAREALAALQDDLKSSGADVKWVEPAQLHVTLKFLGEITEEQRGNVEASLRCVAAAQPPFEAQLEQVGAFPSVRAPRVVWVGFGQGGQEIERLAQQIEEKAAALGFAREDRPFSAHMTLGRVRSPRGVQHLTRGLQEVSWKAPSSWQVKTLRFYQSTLSAAGPTYTVLADCQFAPEDFSAGARG